MLVTNDSALAREFRAMRHWGDRTIEFGVRDTVGLAWNGRMSEIVAAVVLEQLKGYPRHLDSLRDAVATFVHSIKSLDGITLVLGAAQDPADPSYTQVVLRIDEDRIGRSKKSLMDELKRRGVHVWHASFELIPTLSFFRQDAWRDWILRGDVERAQSNYHRAFPEASRVFASTGLGLGKMNFLSESNRRHLAGQLEAALLKRAS